MKVLNLVMTGFLAAVSTFGLTSCSQDEPVRNSASINSVVSRADGEKVMFTRTSVTAFPYGKDWKIPEQGTAVFDALHGRIKYYSLDGSIYILTDESIKNYSESVCKLLTQNTEGVLIWAQPNKQVFDDFCNKHAWLNGVAAQVDWQGNDYCTAIVIKRSQNGQLNVVAYPIVDVKDSIYLSPVLDKLVAEVNAYFK